MKSLIINKSDKMKKIICIIGTRPEAIKMAPVVYALNASNEINVQVVLTAQHREMLDQVLKIFDISSDIDLDLMQKNQSLTILTSRILISLDSVFLTERPDAVLAQGDTTTVMAAALACFYHDIPFGHVEAGLRTGDIYNPFPEEVNRIFAGRLAKWHFAPTEISKSNLLKEGILDSDIFVTGNTVIDALKMAEDKNVSLPFELDPSKRTILVTAHRRENFGIPFENVCKAIICLLENYPDIQVLYPVHPNPKVRFAAYKYFTGHPRVILCEPLGYLEFVSAMKRSYFIMSDSGGVQEEAPALGKPVLVLREETERPEAVALGVAKLVGTDPITIISACKELLDDDVIYKAMSKGVSPYGDGMAARRIADVIKNYFF
jgi:UDP-N-acetylglucosamine 2-epimerase (non-hydrolysing)